MTTMTKTTTSLLSTTLASALCCASLSLAACNNDPAPPDDTDLAQRAYVVSLESPELTVIDLRSHEVISRLDTGGLANHMVEVSFDMLKAYVTSSETDELLVVDTQTLAIVRRVPMGRHPTHLSTSRDGRMLAVMVEGDDAVAFVDTATDAVIKQVPGFYTPHFMRFDHDGRYGYVANLGAHHLTRVDLDTLEIVDHIALEGFAGPPTAVPAPDEGGFGDAQIAADGTLYAAHGATGQVLVYDTTSDRKLPELTVGAKPWVVFAEHPYADLPARHLVPSFGAREVAMIDGDAQAVVATLPGDEEAYGVNYSPRTPDRAFVMNRIREDVAVVDTATGTITSRIDVGGNTETAATSEDGSLIVATVSSADRVVLIDPMTAAVVTTIDGVGDYPWAVTIPRGQGYCH